MILVKEAKHKGIINQLRKTLIRQILDHRQCPYCGKAFIPDDITVADARKILHTLFGKEQ